MGFSFLSLAFPPIDPIVFSMGPLAIRWYGLAYFFGLLLTWRYCLFLTLDFPHITRKDVDDFLIWGVLGVVVGGRLGHVFFYMPHYYFSHPLEIVEVWKGGMSFHGGLLGVAFAFWVYTRWRALPLFSFSDLIVCGIPLGLFLGRIANFINDELYGRVTDVPWAVRFPSGGYLPRHPSQIYEAILEGVLLWLILRFAFRSRRVRQCKGMLTGLFLAGYGSMRIFAEFFRTPEGWVSIVGYQVTYGQFLCFPLVGFGCLLMVLGYFKVLGSSHR